MKLLIVTQKVNIDDPILGFFHDWIKEFANKFEQITVIALEVGKHSLPSNVKVLSLGKESGVSQLKYVYRFYKYIWQERLNYSAVFVHMNPIYCILGKVFWLNKKVYLWYTHSRVNFMLKVASVLVEKILTASNKSLRLRTTKKVVVGHGIDTSKILSVNAADLDGQKLLMVSRISPVKQIEVLIQAVALFRGSGITLDIIGDPVTAEDIKYKEALVCLIKDNQLSSSVKLLGPLVHDEVLKRYADYSLFVNLSKTGSLDKSVLEAMAAGLPVLTTNEAFLEIIPREYTNLCFCDSLSPDEIRRKIGLIQALTTNEKLELSRCFFQLISKQNSLKTLISKIHEEYRN
jgi:glycosyltransferase involved in cell wall biosynthesis